MKITWGKPLVEFGKVVDGAEPAVFTKMPIQKEDTVTLTTTKATAQELFGEGHELVARKNKKSTYVLDMEVFIDSGDERPIVDEDGVVADNYHVRLLPEDDTLTGFQFKNSQVEVEELWSSAEGTKVRYTFTALKPTEGNMFQKYVKSAV